MSSRTFLLPGMGADGRLFPAEWDAIANPVRVNWAECAGARTLGEAAEKLIARHGIGPDDRLVGISLGGMVACEIANRVPVAGLTLIGSTTHPHGVARLLRSIHPMIRVVPLRLIQGCVRRSPCLVHRMFAETDPEFLRAMCLAIFRWKGLRPDCAVNPVRLHGRRDVVIPCPPGAYVVFDGGHMFMLDRAGDCVRALRERGFFHTAA